MGLTHKAEHLLELPAGSLSGEARIEIDGKRSVTVTGTCEIREYETSLVRLTAKSGDILITGDDLQLDDLHSRGISVSGRILSVELV